MAVLSDYVSGTITLTNNSTAFTGTGTGWLAAGFREGDIVFQVAGQTQWTGVIASITSNTAGTLVRPWGGASGTYAYRMRYMSDGARVTAQASSLIELLGNGNIQAEAGLTGAANQLTYWTGPGAKALTPLTPYARTLLDDANATAMQSTLALTPGLLGESAPVPSAAGNGMANGDFDTLTAYGVYTTSGSWANGPRGNPAAHTGLCMVLRRSFGTVYQIFTDSTGMYYRMTIPGAWSKVGVSGENISATQITSGTLPLARGGTGNTTGAINASQVTAGVLPLARGGTGGTTEAEMKGIYTGSAAGNLDFPIGDTVMVFGDIQRNATASIRLDTADNGQYVFDGAGGVLLGTWRARGHFYAGSPTRVYTLMRRVS